MEKAGSLLLTCRGAACTSDIRQQNHRLPSGSSSPIGDRLQQRPREYSVCTASLRCEASAVTATGSSCALLLLTRAGCVRSPGEIHFTKLRYTHRFAFQASLRSSDCQ